MLFNSWIFLFFALIFYPVYWLLPWRAQNVWLLTASYVFYGWWDVRFLLLLWASTLVDWGMGLALDRCKHPGHRRTLLLVSLAFNLGLLCVFKYYNFFIDSLLPIFHQLGWSPSLLHIVLPVGLSFYTFQSISYVVDVYRRQAEPVRNLRDYAVYVAFFPQLVAGPIERAGHMIKQYTRTRVVTWDHLVSGTWLILFGLFKKVVVADNLAILVDGVFNSPTPPDGGRILLGIYAFAFQIYGDFSGYSDIARGLAKFMGIELMMNFNLPYAATNPANFWRRWHISLSTWLRDYLYIALGGNRGSAFATQRNLFLTMLLGGLWHGAAWKFVLWGAYQGALLVVHRWWAGPSAKPAHPRAEADRGSSGQGAFGHTIAGQLGHLVKILVMFQFTCLGWLIFRATDVAQVGSFLTRIVTDFQIGPQSAPLVSGLVMFALPLIILDAWLGGVDDPRTRLGWNRLLGPLTAGALLLALVFLAPPNASSFLYFQF